MESWFFLRKYFNNIKLADHFLNSSKVSMPSILASLLRKKSCENFFFFFGSFILCKNRVLSYLYKVLFCPSNTISRKCPLSRSLFFLLFRPWNFFTSLGDKKWPPSSIEKAAESSLVQRMVNFHRKTKKSSRCEKKTNPLFFKNFNIFWKI